MTPDTLRSCIGCSSALADTWAEPLTAAMAAWRIDTPRRQSAFLATIGVESQRLMRGRENMFYTTAERLLKVFGTRIRADEVEKFLRNPVALGNRVYANRPGSGNGDELSGDGYRFRAGGPLGLTSRANYAAFEAASGYPVTTNPSLIEQPDVGAASAGWFWETNGCNTIIDEDDFAGTQGMVNAGRRRTPPSRINGFDERLALWKTCKNVLGVP